MRPIGHYSGDFSTIQTIKLLHHDLWICWQNFSSIQRWTKQQRQFKKFSSSKKCWKCFCSVRQIYHCSNNFSKIWTVKFKYHKLWTCWQNFNLIQRWTKRQRWPKVVGRNFLSSLFSLSLFKKKPKRWLILDWAST